MGEGRMIAIGVYLVALWHDWASLPTWIRRLIGGVLISALIFGGLALWYHRGVDRAYVAGKKAGIDSVQVAALKTTQAQHDSIVVLHNTLNRAAAASATHEIERARKTAAAIDNVPRALPLPATLDSSGWATLRLELATELTTKDSLLHQVAVPQIRQLADAAEHLLAAYTREHADRLQSDSLAHAWEAKALEHHEPPPAPKPKRVKQLLEIGTYTALVWTIARHIH
jgi:hypothetical protein